MKDLATKPNLIESDNKKDIKHLKSFFVTSVENGLPVALWHSPHENKSYGITSFEGIEKSNIDFEKFKGFVFAPFNNENLLLIKDNLIMDDSGLYSINTDISTDNFLKDYKNNLNTDTISWFKNSTYNDIDYSKNDYVELVNKAIDFIKSGQSKKIVTSRTKKIELNNDFNIIQVFENLVKKYDHAFVSLVSIPDIGTWIGASPEILLKIKDNNLTTMSLAGTQVYKGQPLEEVEWGLKEKEEQSMVTEYIEETFENSGVSNFIKTNTETVIAGNVLHIQTIFNYKSEKINNFATKFINELPPTPAVCGFPKKIAKEFLLENEMHNREFYSGYLGTVNIFGKCDLFVNLRCMQVKNNYAVMYIGGGITADSIPEKEWYETELKSKTLLSVLNNEQL